MNSPTPPQTMTIDGLRFLERLASKAGDGVILEIGPLFGSSTNALDRGRQPGVPIHTIDTFENAPWVRKRTGEDLSRQAFERYTAHISDLTIHEGYAPTVVQETWTDTIGLYFDDATHGNPIWLDNYNFFSKYFSADVITCGDDFASGWPDIITNVYDIQAQNGCQLYVIGRVWAMTNERESRIEEAIDEVFPSLSDAHTTVYRDDSANTTKSAVWSHGLHRPLPIDGFSIESERLSGTFVTYKGGTEVGRVAIGQGTVQLTGVTGIALESDQKIQIQYCCVNSRGKTANSRGFGQAQIFEPEVGDRIVALRLGA